MLEVVCELEGVSESKDRSVDPVDAPYRFGCVPGGAYLAVGVTGIEESAQAGLTAVADLVVGGGEEAAYPIQRVILAASDVPRVSFWTLRRRSSSRWLARRMTWKGSATWRACGNTRLYAFR